MATWSLSNTLGAIAILLPIIGTIDIDLVPLTSIRSALPRRIASAACATACRPEEQKRFTVCAAMVLGRLYQQHADARHVHALLGFGHGAADDRVIDAVDVHARGLGDDAAQHVRKHVVGAGVAEHALGRLANRGAGGGDDVGVLDLLGHCNDLLNRGWKRL